MVGHILIPLRNEVEGVAFPNLSNIKIPQDIFTCLVLIYQVPYECDCRQSHVTLFGQCLLAHLAYRKIKEAWTCFKNNFLGFKRALAYFYDLFVLF